MLGAAHAYVESCRRLIQIPAGQVDESVAEAILGICRNPRAAGLARAAVGREHVSVCALAGARCDPVAAMCSKPELALSL